MVSYAIVQVVFNLPYIVALAIAVAAATIVTFRLIPNPGAKAMFRHGLIMFFLLFGIKLLGTFLTNNLDLDVVLDKTEELDERVTNGFIIEENDTVPVFTSNRAWRDNYGNDFTGALSVREKDYTRLYKHLEKYRAPKDGNFWGNLYKHIDKEDGPSLDLIVKTFEDINAQQAMNKMEFAEMVVSCIQDIQYAFVFQEDCMPPHYYEPAIREILEDCPHCCIGDVIYGVQNPVSFIQNLKGDCDTRTVIIYSILKHFNYDVAILNSDFYRHSILGLNLPASGLHKIYNGKKYVLWETTSKFFEAGDLPGTFDNITHWNVVLTSK